MTETLIKVENVAKKFCRNLNRSLWYGVKDAAAELLGRDHGSGGELRRDEFWALRDISFEVKRGECLGLLGRNGAGKSTLLKMLNGLLKPDAGRIEMHGRVAALIELGAGFNPILTGRENVYVNGAVLGFSKREIDRKFDAIVDFAELRDFIDSPVKNYSSGMKVRLGFAVAAQMEPDVLLIDEVLAVGDIGFKIKCYNEIYRLVKSAAVIFVSHSMPQVGKICTGGLVMKDGLIKTATNDIAKAVESYNELFEFNGTTSYGSGRAKIEQFSLRRPTNSIGDNLCVKGLENAVAPVQTGLKQGEQLNIAIKLIFETSIKHFCVVINFTDMDQRLVAQCHNPTPFFINASEQYIEATTEGLGLSPGKYAVGMTVKETSKHGDPSEVLAGARNIALIQVTGDRYTGAAPVHFAAQWHNMVTIQ